MTLAADPGNLTEIAKQTATQGAPAITIWKAAAYGELNNLQVANWTMSYIAGLYVCMYGADKLQIPSAFHGCCRFDQDTTAVHNRHSLKRATYIFKAV